MTMLQFLMGYLFCLAPWDSIFARKVLAIFSSEPKQPSSALSVVLQCTLCNAPYEHCRSNGRATGRRQSNPSSQSSVLLIWMRQGLGRCGEGSPSFSLHCVIAGNLERAEQEIEREEPPLLQYISWIDSQRPRGLAHILAFSV